MNKSQPGLQHPCATRLPGSLRRLRDLGYAVLRRRMSVSQWPRTTTSCLHAAKLGHARYPMVLANAPLARPMPPGQGGATPRQQATPRLTSTWPLWAARRAERGESKTRWSQEWRLTSQSKLCGLRPIDQVKDIDFDVGLVDVCARSELAERDTVSASTGQCHANRPCVPLPPQAHRSHVPM